MDEDKRRKKKSRKKQITKAVNKQHKKEIHTDKKAGRNYETNQPLKK